MNLSVIAGEPRPRPLRRQPRRLEPEHAAGPRQRPATDRGRRPEAHGDEPRDRDHLLGPGQDRDGRGDHRPSPAPDRHRQRAARNERVDLELRGGDRLHLRCGRFETHLRGIDADEFPAIPAAGERPTTRVSQRVLRQALAEVTFAAASDEARPILTGVLTRFEGDRLTLAAADNYRIAITTIPALDAVEETSIVVPARSYEELARVLADTDDPVEIILAAAEEPGPLPRRGHRPRQPAHRRPVPQLPAGPPDDATRRGSRWTATTSSRRSASRPTSPARRPTSSSSRSRPTGRPRSPSAAAAEVGDHEGVVDATIEGDGTTIAFNARYLGDVLQNVDADRFVDRAQRAALAGRLPAGRRTRPTRTSSCRSGRPPRRRGPGGRRRVPATTLLDLAPPRRLPRLRRRSRSIVRPRAPPRLGPERRRQDEPPGGDRRCLPAGRRTGPATDAELIRWGDAARPRRGLPRRPATTVEVDVTLVREGPSGGRKRIRVNGVAAGATRAAGRPARRRLRPRGHAPRRRCTRPPPRRRSTRSASSASRPTRADLATYGRALDPAQQPAPGDPRGAGRPRPSSRSGTRRSSRPARRSSPPATRSSASWQRPLAAAHAEIAPGEGRLRRHLREQRAAAARRDGRATPSPGGSRETAEKELWNGTTLVGPHRDDLAFGLDGRDLRLVRLARPAAHRDPRPQARRARPAHRARRAPPAPPARRRLLRARPGPARPPRPADRRPARRRS